MKGWISVLACTLFIPIAGAQSRADLEAQRRNLLRQIELNTQLLSKSEQQESATLAQLEGVETRIRLQQELIGTMERELTALGNSISTSEREVSRLRASLDDLKEQQGKQIRQAYIRRKMENDLVYLLSAQSINQAFARWRYLEAMSRVRKQTFTKYSAQQDSVTTELDKLRSLRSQKQRLAESAIAQEKELVTSRKKSKSLLAALRKRESEIRAELDKQKRESERLANEIERLINAEVDKVEAAGSALPNAPALAALTAKFDENRGKLPWPVDRGMITGTFGDQPHPVIKSIKISNNGIDITAPPGERVRAVFDGEVVGKKAIPGFDYMVIVKHGSYYSVYSRLQKVTVSPGDKVRTGQAIGRLPASTGENPKLHFEIWKGKTKSNPEAWISRG
jgi:septal ring factor EnvC (AmiA/AmiB activator)